MVTLGIIGVVSAMTVPTLMQNHQRKTYVTQLHKVYNETLQALLEYQTDRNAVNLVEAGLNSNEAFQDFIKNYMKVVLECDNMGVPCFADNKTYKNLDGNNISGIEVNHKSFLLSSGVALRGLYLKQSEKLFNLYVDINGQKGPNILGRDLFIFGVYNNVVLDSFTNDSSSAPLTKEQREKATGTWKPFADILNDNWEMNY